MQGNIIIHKGNFNNPIHKKAFSSLLKAYMSDPMGTGKVPGEDHLREVVLKLKQYPQCHIFLANVDNSYVGMAVCFSAFSTFNAKELVNIHDFIIVPEYRNKGIASALLQEVEEFARRRDCCKITLEIREDNLVAMELYKKFGFGEEKIPMKFWVKEL